MTYDYEISKDGDFLKFERDHGEGYGSVHKTTVDCQGREGKQLYNHIKKYAGKAFANAAKNHGFC